MPLPEERSIQYMRRSNSQSRHHQEDSQNGALSHRTPRTNTQVTGSPAREASAALAASSGSVRVVCRLRPMSEREKKAGTVPAATASTERKEVAVVRMLGGGTRQVRSHFHFDEVLTSFSTQSDVFAATLDPLVDEVLAGYEATAFAYGQTGTGKTYTMEGELGSDAGRGLVPRTAAALIERLNKGKYADYSISCSYLEIYNEELSDLLAPAHLQQCRLDLKDVGNGRGVVCTGLSEVPVGSLSDILDLVRAAQERRRVAETRVNARSSRSHCIFTLRVKCRRIVAAGELENSGKLHLVDLAGSECAKKASASFATNEEAMAPSGSYDKRNAWSNVASEEDRERKSINQSLLTLGRVISALRDGSGRVPYRDSKLTRLLQDALGGRCKTVIIATISPALNAVEETISTLSYAEQACGVKNRPVATSLLRTIRLAANGGAPAPSDASTGLSTTGISSSDWAELEMKVAYLTQEVEEAQAALAVQYREVEDQTEKAALAEASLQDALLEREEFEHLYNSLGAFTDGRLEVEGCLRTALDHTWQRGDELRQVVLELQEKAAKSRLQARVAVDSAATTSATLSKALREMASTIQQLAQEAYAAHKGSTDAAADMTSEEDVATCELRSQIREAMSSWKTLMETLMDKANATLDSASQALVAQTALTRRSAARVEEEGAALEEEVNNQLSSSAADDETRFGETKALLAAVSSALRSNFDRASTDLATAQAEGLTEMEARMKFLRDRVQEPVEELSKGLRRCLGQSDAQREGLAGLLDKVQAHAKNDGNRAGVLADAASAFQDRHNRECSEAQAALRKNCEELADTLKETSSTVEVSLTSLGTALAGASKNLEEGTAESSKRCEEALEDSRKALEGGWGRQSEALEDLHAQLSQTGELQKSSNVGISLAKSLRTTSDELKEAISRDLTRLLASHERAMRELVEIKAQRRSEVEAVNLLQKQREVLQADVSALQSESKSLRESLAKGRGELEQLVTSQASARDKALAAVTSVLEEHFGSLGRGLGEAAAALSDRLTQSEERLEKASGEAEAMLARSNASNGEVKATVQGYACAVQRSVEVLEGTQEVVEGTRTSLLKEQEDTCSQLGSYAETSEEWARRCDEVSGQLAAATDASSELRTSLLEGAASWEVQRNAQVGHIKEWSEEMEGVVAALDSVEGQRRSSQNFLDNLRAKVSARHGQLLSSLDASLQQEEARVQELTSLLEMQEQHKKQRSEESTSTCEVVSDLGLASGELSEALTSRAHENERIAENLKEEVEMWPVGLQATNAKLKKVDEANKATSEEVFDRFSNLNTMLQSLQAQRRCTDGNLRATLSKSCSVLQESSAALQTAAEEIDEVFETGRSTLCSSLSTASESQTHIVDGLSGAVATAEQTALAARKRGCQRVLLELQRGEQTQKRSIEEAARGSEGAFGDLQRYVQSLRSALSSPPLAAFDDDVDALSKPEFPEKFETAVLARPTKEDLLKGFLPSRSCAYDGKENLSQANVGQAAKESVKEGKKAENQKDARTVLSEIR